MPFLQINCLLSKILKQPKKSLERWFHAPLYCPTTLLQGLRVFVPLLHKAIQARTITDETPECNYDIINNYDNKGNCQTNIKPTWNPSQNHHTKQNHLQPTWNHLKQALMKPSKPKQKPPAHDYLWTNNTKKTTTPLDHHPQISSNEDPLSPDSASAPDYNAPARRFGENLPDWAKWGSPLVSL